MPYFLYVQKRFSANMIAEWEALALFQPFWSGNKRECKVLIHTKMCELLDQIVDEPDGRKNEERYVRIAALAALAAEEDFRDG
jgi:hypothetical protein